MKEESAVAQPGFKNHGWRVTFTGMGINLALGILYTWSVISKHVPEEWNWKEDDKSLPYMVACLIFSLVMVPAGRKQDKIGPRLVATIGGVLVCLGFIFSSLTSSLMVFVIGFGVLAGAGLMIISKLTAIADKQAGISLGFVLVAVLAVGNGGGRIVTGVLSDKIGRKAILAGRMYEVHQTFAIAYYGASALLVLAAIMVFLLKPPHHSIESAKV